MEAKARKDQDRDVVHVSLPYDAAELVCRALERWAHDLAMKRIGVQELYGPTGELERHIDRVIGLRKLIEGSGADEAELPEEGGEREPDSGAEEAAPSQHDAPEPEGSAPEPVDDPEPEPEPPDPGPEPLTLDDYEAAMDWVVNYSWDEERWPEEPAEQIERVLELVRASGWEEAKAKIEGTEEAPPEAEEEPAEFKPTPELVEGAREFLGRMAREIGHENAFNADMWTDDPGPEVMRTIELVSKLGWVEVQKLADPEGPDGPDEAEEEPAEPHRWNGYSLEASGEGLPKDIPYRVSMVKSDLTLSQIRHKWKAGTLQSIGGIGAVGEKKLTEWFAEGEAGPGADPEPGPTGPDGASASSGASEEPDIESAVSLLDKAGVVDGAGGGTLELVPTSRGFRVLQTVPDGDDVLRPHPDGAGLSKVAALDLARRILAGEDDDPPGPAGRDPQVGDQVVIQVPEARARQAEIVSITAEEPRVARLQNGDGEAVGTCRVEHLTWLLGADGWTVHTDRILT